MSRCQQAPDPLGGRWLLSFQTIPSTEVSILLAAHPIRCDITVVHELTRLLNSTSALSLCPPWTGGGGCSHCNPLTPTPIITSLVHPNESLCYHHHHHSCHGNLAWGFGGMCGIAGDWLLGARCFPIKPVTGVCGSPPLHEGRRERESTVVTDCVILLWWCLNSPLCFITAISHDCSMGWLDDNL